MRTSRTWILASSCALLTITAERAKHVDFSSPFASGVSEVVVTGPSP